MKLTIIAAAVLALGASTQAQAQVVSAGRVLIVAGTASLERAGQQTPVAAGTEVQSGDTLSVGEKSTLQVRFTDESVVALRANSQFKIENYKFDKNADTDRSLMGLIKGGMRTITGLIGKANNKSYGVQTVIATIGIRGTHFAIASCNNDCTRADGTPEANGTFGTVTDGVITVTNGAGTVELGQQESFYVASANAPLIRLLTPPGVLADRGASSRGRVTSGAAQGAPVGEQSGGSSHSGSSGTRVSTSPQSTELAQTRVSLSAQLTAFSSNSQPGVVMAAGKAPAPAPPPTPAPPPAPAPSPIPVPGSAPTGSQFSFVEFSGSMAPNGVSVTNQSGVVYPNLILSSLFTRGESDFANAVVTDAKSAATAISRFRTVSSDITAAGVYWYYIQPTLVNEFGIHRAFGDAPVGDKPTSGIATYNYSGSTQPTDNYGRAGSFETFSLTMNFGSQTVQNNVGNRIVFGSNDAMKITTIYTIAAQTFSMNAGLQTLTGVSCTGCNGTTIGTVNGQFLGADRKGFAASFLVRNTQLLGPNTANAGGNVAVYVRP